MKYTIKEVVPEVFAVIIKDKYDRAMTFCRAQEYYECPNPKFRGKNFSIWDYMKWYGQKCGRGFSYGADWSGFNIPLRHINACYKNPKRPTETPYDHTMRDILDKINSMNRGNVGYVIACGDTKGDTFKHEVCHGLYYTSPQYKIEMACLTAWMPKNHYKILKDNIIAMGYAPNVVNDEIQAYFQYGYENEKFGKGLDPETKKQYHKAYRKLASWFHGL